MASFRKKHASETVAESGRMKPEDLVAFAVRTAAADQPGAVAHRLLLGAIGRGVVRDHQPGAGEGLRQGVQGRADSLRLVLRRHDHDALGFRRHRRLLSRRVADVEAHITGTVWKIEVKVGDQVDEGDTVVILESMKMEMPVEAEDPGKVSEIRCEEGQSVSEGEVLVVLE